MMMQVSNVFQGLFPDTFDRAVPVINHKEVDGLLLQVPLVPYALLTFHCVCHQPLVVLTVLFLFHPLLRST